MWFLGNTAERGSATIASSQSRYPDVARGYISKLLANARVSSWLSQNRQEYLGEFQKIAQVDTITSFERRKRLIRRPLSGICGMSSKLGSMEISR